MHLLDKIPSGITVFKDNVHGVVQFPNSTLDDMILLKSDGYPTYHLANVVDDHLMQITHVLRGEEWLTSAPKHVLLYAAFGWKHPQFAHVPLLLNHDRSKLSKRMGHVSIEKFEKDGYLPEAVVNFLALLGWTPPNNREIYTNMKELVRDFSADQITNSGAVVDLDKLEFINKQHMMILMESDTGRNRLLGLLRPIVQHEFQNYAAPLNDAITDEYILKIMGILKGRIRVLSDIKKYGFYFFRDLTKSEISAIPSEVSEHFDDVVREALTQATMISPFSRDVEEYKAWVECVQKRFPNISKKKMWLALRFAICGTTVGGSIMDTLALLGEKTIVRRLQFALQR